VPDDLRVQRVDHPGGARSYLVLDIATGCVHERGDRFLAGHGEGTQRTYAHHMVDHLRWLWASGRSEDRVRIGDLGRYMALCGATGLGPLGTPWQSAPLSSSALSVAACPKGCYLDVTTREDVNAPLREALSVRRLATGRDRDRSVLGHLTASVASNPLSHGAPLRRHPRMLPDGTAAAMLAAVHTARDSQAPEPTSHA